jgi:hypothetical protein
MLMFQCRLADRDLLRETLDAGYRSLSVKLHPDHVGGDLEKMTRLNIALAAWREQLA